MNLGGAFISAGAGLLGGMFSGIGANKRQEAALKAQREEAEKARQWQSQQRDKQNKWQEQMFDKSTQVARENIESQRLYESPAQQMARYKAAGLNPDLIYGSAGGMTQAAMSPSPMSSSSVGSSPVPDVGSTIMGTPSMAESVVNGLQASKTWAEIQNIREDTAKKKGESTSIDLDNIRKAATNGSMIELDNFQITLAKQAASLNDAQLSNLSQSLNNLKSQNDLFNAQIAETFASAGQKNAQTTLARIEAALSAPRFDMECRTFAQNLKESDSRISLNAAEAKQILVLTLAKKLNLDADTLLKKVGVSNMESETVRNYAQSSLLNIQGRSARFSLEQANKYDDAERIIGMSSAALSALGSILGGGSGMVKALAK